ncbi:MAG: polyribonucleotide nucleotidyltransferase [Anaplasmataceae bacterium]|nr:polyribonucleotide nucleotidyltransferase [Anaplasmataceae bacterium]
MSNTVISDKINWCGLDIELKHGQLAYQALSSIVVKCAKMQWLIVVTSNNEINYEENNGNSGRLGGLIVNVSLKSYSNGKIPTGFFKREGKITEKEILLSRLLDRSIRPIVDTKKMGNLHLNCILLSHDPDVVLEVPLIIASSVALGMIKGLPLESLIVCAKVSLINKKYHLNSIYTNKESLSVFVSGGEDNLITMIESESCLEVSKDEILNAIKEATCKFDEILSFLNDFIKKLSDKKREFYIPEDDEDDSSDELLLFIKNKYSNDIYDAYFQKDKHIRIKNIKKIHNAICLDCKEHDKELISNIISLISSQKIRESIMDDNLRIGGRKCDEIRGIDIELDILENSHGSALFTRGYTQSLAVITLGTAYDAQVIDSVINNDNKKETFILHYNFPSFSVGEANMPKAPGRREIGHGKLAWKALNAVIPTNFPYTTRIVSEILSSDGSSSMATVCASSLALFSTGVGMKRHVAGVAMGLIFDQKNKKYKILTDICGEEDALGDMDLKVAATIHGITALQMDIKIKGIDWSMISQALDDAILGTKKIISQMDSIISKPVQTMKPGIPAIISFIIEKNDIKRVVGVGGRVIKNICEENNVKIDINPDGNVVISGINFQDIKHAKGVILGLLYIPTIGMKIDGSITEIKDDAYIIEFFGKYYGILSKNNIVDHSIIYKVGDFINLIIIDKDADPIYKYILSNIIDDIEKLDIEVEELIKVEHNDDIGYGSSHKSDYKNTNSNNQRDRDQRDRGSRVRKPNRNGKLYEERSSDHTKEYDDNKNENDDKVKSVRRKRLF